MKGIALLIISIAIIGCTKSKTPESDDVQHIFSTYYGNIDIDTITVGFYDIDNSPCYQVYIDNTDTIFFNPHKSCYLVKFPTNDEHGNAIIDYDPTEKYK